MTYTINYGAGHQTVSEDIPIEHPNPEYAGPDGMIMVTMGKDSRGIMWREIIDVAWITSIEVSA